MNHPKLEEQSLRSQIHEIGACLQTSLTTVLSEISGLHLRPIVFSKTFKLDDSLSARLLRSIRTNNPLSSLREAPAPQGLRLFLAAAARAKASPTTLATAEEAVRDFERLLDQFPIGRTSLNTTIDGWLPAGRARAERAAKQGMFKSMAHMMGFTIDVVTYTVIYQPAANGLTCDNILMVMAQGVRRLREGFPIMLFGTNVHRDTDPVTQNPVKQLPGIYRETLDGEREATDARKYIISDISDDTRFPLDLIETSNRTEFVLDRHTLPVNVPANFGIGGIYRNFGPRYHVGFIDKLLLQVAPRLPAKMIIVDLLLYDGLSPDFTPHVIPKLYSATDNTNQQQERELNRVDLDVELARFGWGVDSLGLKEWSQYQPTVKRTFERAGWDPTRFRAFRCQVQYPVPFVSLNVWIDLPPPPEDVRVQLEA